MNEGMGILEIEDRGKGMPSGILGQSAHDWMGSPGVGVRGMNERMRQLGGRLEFVSMESGTTVRAIVPAGESSFLTSSPSAQPGKGAA
jgi:signal transduction histidine kinase